MYSKYQPPNLRHGDLNYKKEAPWTLAPYHVSTLATHNKSRSDNSAFYTMGWYYNISRVWPGHVESNLTKFYWL